MAESIAYTAKKSGALWIQPDGPNTKPYFLGCHDVGDLEEPGGGIELIRCFKPDGSGWDVVGQTESPPDPVTLDITGLLFKERDYLEKVRCPFGLYILHRSCGQANVFANYERGEILQRVRRASRTYSGLVMREEDASSTVAVALEAWPPLLDVDSLVVDRMTTSEVNALNGIDANLESRCYGDCGETLDQGEHAVIAADSAAGPATANILFSEDEGLTWAAGAADPFGAGLHAMAVVRFPIGRDTIRILAAEQGVVATQGLVAYSDDDGATWTTVNIGGPAAGHGPITGRSLFALDQLHIWLATRVGYIYFSEDGGETWTAQEAGVVTVTDYYFIHFADGFNGIAGAAADVIAVTTDGGQTWAAATATGGGGEIFCGWALDENRFWVGTDDGTLWFSNDGGTTWTQRTGWTGSATGDIKDLAFVNEYQGFMAYDTAAAVGKILRTIDGGYTWELLTTPTVGALNRLVAPKHNLAYAVGEASGGTGVILKVHAA